MSVKTCTSYNLITGYGWFYVHCIPIPLDGFGLFDIMTLPICGVVCIILQIVRIKIVIIHKGYGKKSVVKYFNFPSLYVCCFSFASFLFIMLQYICFCCYFQKLVSE